MFLMNLALEKVTVYRKLIQNLIFMEPGTMVKQRAVPCKLSMKDVKLNYRKGSEIF